MKLILSIALLAFAIAAAAAIPLSESDFDNALDADLEMDDDVQPAAMEEASSDDSEDLELETGKSRAKSAPPPRKPAAPPAKLDQIRFASAPSPKPAAPAPTSACAAGEFAPAGSSNCKGCPPGSSSPAKSTSCTKCPAGTFAAGTYSPRCTPCPVGSFNDRLGATSCKLCAGGYTSPVAGASKCVMTEYACPKGSIWTGSQCAKTTDGWKDRCPVNTYWESSERSCKSCPAGTVYGLIGAMSVKQCKPCPAGSATFLGKSGYGCSRCPPGSFTRYEGERECELAPKGTHVAQSGQTMYTVNSCPRGTSGAGDGPVGATRPQPCKTCPADRPFGDGHNCCTQEEGATASCGPYPFCPATRKLYGKGLCD